MHASLADGVFEKLIVVHFLIIILSALLSLRFMHLRFLFLHESKSGTSKGKIQGKTEYVVVGTLDDRSFLSDEMAAMCAKLPIYRIKQRNLLVQRKLNNASIKKINVDKIFKSVLLQLTARAVEKTKTKATS